MPLGVLIVDDHWMAREAIRTALRLSGSVETEIVGEAADGSSALEMARELRPDVVTMDIGLPDMDGVEATRRLKAAMPGIGVVMVTVHGDPEYREEASKAGAGAFVTKDRLVQELPTCLALLASRASACSRPPGSSRT